MKAKQKARAKANAMPTKSKLFEFVDKAGVPGSCTVTLPAERFSYIITRRVAENLLVKHGYNLPFDIMTPPFDAPDDDWMGLTPEDLTDGKLDKDRKEFEIWLDFETTD